MPQINAILFLLLPCLWSGSFIGIKVVVATWPPIFGAAVRIAFALLSIAILMKVMRKKVHAPFSLIWKLWIIGLFAQGIPLALLFWGERFVSPGLAGILNGTVPIWTYVFALLFMRELTSFSILKTLGLLIGILGIITIFWPLLTFNNDIMMIFGAGAILIMAMSYAICNLLNQYLFSGGIKVDFFTNIYHQLFGAVIFLVIVSLIFEKWLNIKLLESTWQPWIACLYLGVCSSALAFIIYYHLIREWDALRASTVLYIVPVLTLLWDYLFFNNRPGISEIMGVLAILVGVILIQLSSLSKEFFHRIANKYKPAIK